MKKKNAFILLLAASSLFSLTGCELFENGDVKDYVGDYYLEISFERVKHYYWGTTKLISETEIAPVGSRITIADNKKVTFYYPGGDLVTNGKVKVFKDYVRFTGLSFSSSYKFKKTNNGKDLDYTYSSSQVGVDYDFTTRRMYFKAI